MWKANQSSPYGGRAKGGQGATLTSRGKQRQYLATRKGCQIDPLVNPVPTRKCWDNFFNFLPAP